jgi:hypothetical protein
MSNTKLSLTIYLEGATLKQGSKVEVPVVKTKRVFSKEAKKVVLKEVVEYIHVTDRTPTLATQVINMTDDAYDAMIGNSKPYFAKTMNWSHMSKTKRLEAHLKNITEHLGGINYRYEVFED